MPAAPWAEETETARRQGRKAAVGAAEVEEAVGGEERGEAAADGGERREGGAGHAGEALEEELVGERGDGGLLSVGGWVGGGGGSDGDGHGDVAGGVGGDAGPGEPREAAGVAALRGHGCQIGRELAAHSLRPAPLASQLHWPAGFAFLGKSTGDKFGSGSALFCVRFCLVL